MQFEILLKGTRTTTVSLFFCRTLQRNLMQRCKGLHHQQYDTIYGHIGLQHSLNEGRFSNKSRLIFQDAHFWTIHFQHCNKSWVTTSSHGISNHSTNILMRDTIMVSAISIHNTLRALLYGISCGKILRQRGGLYFVRVLPLNFPIVFKVKHVYTLLICYSCSFQRGHSSTRLTFFVFSIRKLLIEAIHRHSPICFMSDPQNPL